MRLQEKVADCQGIKAALYNIIQRIKIALGFAHLLAINHYKLVMQPKTHDVSAKCTLGLGNLVSMVDRNMIHSAGVNINLPAQIFYAHRRAFNVPTGETLSPRTVPFHLPAHTCWR